MDMWAAVMKGIKQPLSIEKVQLAEPKAGEVLVKIMATGVCHSDLNAVEDESTPIPTILGHEGARGRRGSRTECTHGEAWR